MDHGERAHGESSGACLGSRPAFIVGCHRSGTTLLRYLLDAHPALACPPESKFLAGFEAAVMYPQALRGLGSLGVASDRLLCDLRAVAEQYFEEFAARQGKRRWVDKTPNHVRMLPFLDALFGSNAQFILMVRHPFDTADSLATVAAFNVDEPEDPDIAASVAQYGRDRTAWIRHWTDMTETLLWFQARTTERAWLVRYEDLVTAPARTLDGVLTFLEEVRSSEILEEMINAAFACPHAPGYADAKIRESGGIHDGSVGKWMRWPASDLARLWTIAREMAERLGYEEPRRGGGAYAVA